jgi:hypothetical protein
VAATVAASSACAPRWLAAEPRRKYSICGSLPSSLRDLSMKPVRRVVSIGTLAQSTPSASSAART